MDSRGPPMYLHPGMSMMGESHLGSVPGSIPINVPMGNPTSEVTGMSGVRMSGNHPNFSRKAEHNIMPEQQHYNQLPLRKEAYDEGKFSSADIPKSSDPLPTEDNNFELEDIQQEVKTENNEEEDIANFIEAAHDVFLKVSSKEITLKAGADMLGRPYSFVYSRYQEFCDKVTGDDLPEIRKKKKTKKKKKGRRPKRLTLVKSNSRLKGEVYQCKECPATFNTEYLIKTHAKVHVEGNESHLCTACGVVFSKLNKLMQHRVDSHQEALQCPHCDSQYTTVVSYKSHILTHTGGKPFQCSECGKGFNGNYALTIHKRSHTGERPFMCGFCEKTFMTLNGLKSHRYVHTGGQDKPFECELCGKRYQFNSALADHMNTHTGAKPYACDMCDMRYNFKANLMRHKMTHTGEGPHKCDLCPATFYLRTELKSHRMAHTGIKPFKCDQCDYSCTRKINMEFHRNTHSGETPFKCDFYGCNAAYPRPNSLRKHKLKLKHGLPPPLTCKYCHEKFSELIALKRHMMAHTGEKPHTCEQCFKTFVDVSSLKRHMWTHMYRPLSDKPKQVRKRKQQNPGVKKVPTPEIVHKKWTTEYQVPIIAENGHGSQGLPPSSSQGLPPPAPAQVHYTWNTNAEDSNSQPAFHPFTASQYTNLVNTGWPSTMDPDELRRRLLNSFK